MRLGDERTISRWILPARHQIQSCAQLSLPMLFEDYDDPETTSKLRSIWASIFGTVLMAAG